MPTGSPAAPVRWALVPGTCGEFVQGALAGVDLLVSCPIDRFARAAVLAAPGAAAPDAWLRPLAGFPKVRAAVAAFLRRHGIESLTGRLVVESALPRGKGMGSSTAEILAALAATAAHLGLGASPLDLTRAALAVEPTDSVAWPGLALLDHRRGRLGGPLGTPPAMELLLLDTGREVDTLAFNRIPDLDALNRRKEPAVREALALLLEGVTGGRPDRIGRAATLSALAHQEILPRPELGQALAAGREAGALGVVAAHSGGVLGLLFDPRLTPAAGARARLEDRLGRPLSPARIVGGGIRWRKTPAEPAGAHPGGEVAAG